MPNKNYIKGRRYEYKNMDMLWSIGCHIVFRSAGSHSPIDVIGIDLEKKHIFFLQCKPESMSDNKKKELENKLKELNGRFTSTFEVV
jgi:hypothetical protein